MSVSETILEQLRGITEEILDMEKCQSGNASPVYGLHDLFVKVLGSNILKENMSAHQDRILSNGKALSAFGAAHCLIDQIRTVKYIQGLYAGILEAQKRFPGKRINVLYAGCGPYASLAVPLCSVFNAEDVAFTLVEINEYSLNSARKLIKNMKLEAWIDDYCLNDATTYKYPKGKELHLVVSETLQACLANEPQVAINLNLVPQLTENGLFIPNNITLDVAFGNIRIEQGLSDVKGSSFSKIDTVFNLMTSIETGHDITNRNNAFPIYNLEIPKKETTKDALYLLTNIEVFDKIVLQPYESSLTIPKLILEYNNSINVEMGVFQYVMGEQPQLNVKFNYKTEFIPLF